MERVKRPRLIEFGRSARLSRTALQELLKQIEEHGVPDAYSRSTQEREIRTIATQLTSFGPRMQQVEFELTNGTSMKMWYVHPLAMLEIASAKSDAAGALLIRVLNENKNNVSLFLYNDEVDPGRELAARHSRKIEAVYWSLVEFGLPALNHEDFYFTLTILRSDIRAKIAGGMSQVLRNLLRHVFNKHGHDFRNGILFRFRNEDAPRLVFGTVRVMLQDERAHKGITHAKGASGTMPCTLCMNVFNHKCKKPSPHDIPMTHLDVGDFVLHSNESIKSILKRLQDRAIARTCRLQVYMIMVILHVRACLRARSQ